MRYESATQQILYKGVVPLPKTELALLSPIPVGNFPMENPLCASLILEVAPLLPVGNFYIGKFYTGKIPYREKSRHC